MKEFMKHPWHISKGNPFICFTDSTNISKTVSIIPSSISFILAQKIVDIHNTYLLMGLDHSLFENLNQIGVAAFLSQYEEELNEMGVTINDFSISKANT